jgi:hypothetical protein
MGIHTDHHDGQRQEIEVIRVRTSSNMQTDHF